MLFFVPRATDLLFTGHVPRALLVVKFIKPNNNLVEKLLKDEIQSHGSGLCNVSQRGTCWQALINVFVVVVAEWGMEGWELPWEQRAFFLVIDRRTATSPRGERCMGGHILTDTTAVVKEKGKMADIICHLRPGSLLRDIQGLKVPEIITVNRAQTSFVAEFS